MLVLAVVSFTASNVIAVPPAVKADAGLFLWLRTRWRKDSIRGLGLDGTIEVGQRISSLFFLLLCLIVETAL